METLSKDILFVIGLYLDLPSITCLRQTCKNIKEKLDKNIDKDHFWTAKLKKNFNLSGTENPKKYYLDVNSYIQKYPNTYQLLKESFKLKRKDLVKVAIFKGIDIEKNVTSRDQSVLDSNIIISEIHLSYDEEYNVLLFEYFYDHFLRSTFKFYKETAIDKRIRKAALISLEREFKIKKELFRPNFYNDNIDFYRKSADF